MNAENGTPVSQQKSVCRENVACFVLAKHIKSQKVVVDHEVLVAL